MKLQFKNIIICAFLIQGLSFQLFSQETFTDEKRAEYIFSFSKNVVWLNSTFTTFRMGILDKDSLLYYMIQDQANKTKTLHNKPIEVILFHSIDEITPTEVLFLEYANKYDIGKINTKIGNTQTLLLTENFPFNKSMINFTDANGKRNYEINGKRLLDKKLQVNPLLLSHAIKTKEDWENLYAQTEALLEKEKGQNVEKTKIISTQKKYIHTQKSEINTLHKTLSSQEIELQKLSNAIEIKQLELDKTLDDISKRSEEIKIQKQEQASLKKNIAQQQKTLNSQSNQLQSQEGVLVAQLDKIQTQKIIIYLSISIIVIIMILGFLLIRLYRRTKKYNRTLKQKNIEIYIQNEKIIRQNKEITDSIIYARRIQHAILPPQEIIRESIPDHFILFKPRDIVSGDYYWMTQIENKVIITAADCTGHGVPGAFMSLLGITFLNEIVHEKKIVQTDKILNELRERIINSMNKNSKIEEYKDGMDMAICMINKDTLELEYSGAYNSLYIIRNGELQEIKADKMPVGLSEKSNESFSVSSLLLQKGDTFYMYSDGYADQFGGPNNRKFMTKSFKELLIVIQDKSMDEQKEILDSTIENWRGTTEQIDDIIVIGIKI